MLSSNRRKFLIGASCLVLAKQAFAGCCTLGAYSPNSVSLASQTLFAVGSYSAYIGALVGGATGTQTVTVQPASFPNATQVAWNISGGTAGAIKDFLQFGSYGNYFGTVVPAPIVPCQVQNITSLTITHNLTFSGTGYNVIYDLWLSADMQGNTHQFEVEVFLHPDSTAITYFNSVTSLATSVTISGVAWDISIDNTASPKDILFMPHSRADVPSATLDLKAMLAELVTLAAITGKEFYTGHALGVETITGSGTLTATSVSTSYSPGAPIQANYIGTQALNNAFWTPSNVTASASQMLETTANSTHFLGSTSTVTRAAATKTYMLQVDAQNADPGHVRQLLVGVFDSTFADVADAYFDLINPLNSADLSAGGGWSNTEITISPLGGGTYRCMLQFTTDATSTGFIPRFQIENGSGVLTYPGVVTAGLNLSNSYLYNVAAGSGGS